MKYHIVLKFVAIVLCTCFLVAALAAGAAVIGIAAAGLYSSSVQELQEQNVRWQMDNLATSLAEQYAARELGRIPEPLIDIFCPMYIPGVITGEWYYTIADAHGNLLAGTTATLPTVRSLTYWVDSTYPVILEHSVLGQNGRDPTDITTPQMEMENTMPGKTADRGTTSPTAGQEYYRTRYLQYQDADGVEHEYSLGMCWGPSYEVTILLAEEALEMDDGWEWQLAELGYQYRYVAIGVLFGAAVLFAAAFTYLCYAAGRAPGGNAVHPGGLNRLPLDLYALGVGSTVIAGFWICGELLSGSSMEDFIPVAAVIAAMAAVVCLALVGFLFAFAAQVKAKDGFWWRRSLVGRVLRFCVRVLRWIVQGISRFVKLLPLTWQWLLMAAAMGIMVLFAVTIRSGAAVLFAMAVCIAVVVYGACCFGKLLEGVRRMSRGNLGNKVSSVMMVGSFRDFATDLNALADVAVEAAKRQMTSERMKAELVTNVSHDIKTPLTSIINYVDLLQKAETQEQRQQYLEVLARQSQRMKKLIEDLVEMSKASSGAIACELTRVDAAETVNQALGEFADKLEQVGLIPVVRYPETPVGMVADGRLTWRVLSNLLSNVVKYAMPSTRLYIDIVRLEGRVLISLKNISREPLNVDAGELLERFVRGDASRNTEGSGLGLNIAKSLMERQHGQLQLLIDGDLFKATMILPEAR